MKSQPRIKPPQRFLRSTHLERDFYDRKALTSYVLTDVAIDCLRRISSGLRRDSSQRSWRLIGDYGSGKSSFALLLAHWFAGHAGKFPGKLSTQLAYSRLNAEKPNLLPILVTGSREPLSATIRRGIEDAIRHHYPAGFGQGRNKIASILKHESLTDSEVLELLTAVNEKVRADKKGTGLLLIIDELGKSLEFAASQAGESDVFLMQRLAEEASRSGNTPFFIIGILHQGFGAYASALGLTAKHEWEKVAGRYDEIVFQHPMEQTTALVSEALNVDAKNLTPSQITNARKAMDQAVQQGWYGAGANMGSLNKIAHTIYPLDPSVLPLLSRVLHRFGQNQRSIFSFLFGSEAYALQSFLGFSENEPYRTHNFYDYIHSNLGHHLASSFSSTHWTTIDSMVGSYITDQPLHAQIVKTVGVFNLLNNNDLKATPEVVSLCITGRVDDKRVHAAVQSLQSDEGKRVLFDRGRAGGLCLWPHISADLQRAQESAESMIGPVTSPTEFIKTHLENTNLVARRHYIETGNLRHFPIAFCKPSDLSDPSRLLEIDADGVALTPLCLNKADVAEAIKKAQSSEFNDLRNCLVIIPGQLQRLTPLIREVQVWEWIATNTPELNGDKYARETVSRKRVAAELALEEAISNAIGFDQTGRSFSLKCFWKGEPLNVSSGKALISALSDICDDLYEEAPLINNELINRRNISSAAAAARMRLIEGVLEFPDKPFLGMDQTKKPPEMSMYMSVLQAGALHVSTGESAHFEIPSKRMDILNLRPTFSYLEKRLKDEVDDPVSVDVLLGELSEAPYGIRGGLAPLLLAIFYAINKQNIACYENGTFISELTGAEFLRLTKKPEIFEFQYCNVSGLRTDAFERLASVLNILKLSNEPELLDVVRPLCILVAGLPPYSQKTKSISPTTVAVRDALMDARDPLKLLFELLPVACGCEPISSKDGNKANAENYIKNLQDSIDELQKAYGNLLNLIETELMDNFGCHEQKKSSFRAEISKRAEVLFPYVTEKDLKAFC
ncbi:MAG: hypothetical protein JXR25_10240 [Pontiellaceae bacterium]|nr:hypothetical protein [Pontiellaceae bacterium]MBN2785198.1 hypothetical protein [Pontiellaceae bacterium]